MAFPFSVSINTFNPAGITMKLYIWIFSQSLIFTKDKCNSEFSDDALELRRVGGE